MKEEHFNTLLGLQIAERRNSAGISQAFLARSAGLSRTYLSDIERGVRNISVTTLHRLAKALGTFGSELLTEVEKRIGSVPQD
jgi:transcriptional regulator with XRE-family HTH domain